jgi:hypothetical protein
MRVMFFNNPPPARRYKSEIVCIFVCDIFFCFLSLWRVMIQVYNYYQHTHDSVFDDVIFSRVFRVCK